MIQLRISSTIKEQSRRAAAKIDAEIAGVLTEIGTDILTRQRLSFERKSRGGAGDEGVVWAKLSPVTIRLKTKGRGGDTQIGVDTGRMRNAVEPGFLSDGPVNVFEVHDYEVEVGYRGEYVEYFDQGTPRMPARPLMPGDGDYPASWTESVERTVFDWLDEVAAEFSIERS